MIVCRNNSREVQEYGIMCPRARSFPVKTAETRRGDLWKRILTRRGCVYEGRYLGSKIRYQTLWYCRLQDRPLPDLFSIRRGPQTCRRSEIMQI